MNFILDSDLLVAQENSYTCVVDPANSIKGHIWYVFLGDEMLFEGHEDTIDKSKLASEKAYRDHYKAEVEKNPDSKQVIEAATDKQLDSFSEQLELLYASVQDAHDAIIALEKINSKFKLSKDYKATFKDMKKNLNEAAGSIDLLYDEGQEIINKEF